VTSSPLTKKQKDALLIGGLAAAGIITGTLIYKATARPPPAPTKRYRCTGPPNYECVEDPAGPYLSLEECRAYCKEAPYPPATLYFENSNITITQLYYAHTYSPSFGVMCLGIWAVLSYEKPLTEGYVWADPKLKVVDAMGRGVPNILVDVWSSPTTDDQGGFLEINGVAAPPESPVSVQTGADGTAPLTIRYKAQNCEVIAKKHSCQQITPILIPIGYVGCGGCVWAPNYIGYCTKDVETYPKIYSVYAQVHGTVLTTPGAVVVGKLKSHAEIFP
jgi:hypothetical protein